MKQQNRESWYQVIMVPKPSLDPFICLCKQERLVYHHKITTFRKSEVICHMQVNLVIIKISH